MPIWLTTLKWKQQEHPKILDCSECLLPKPEPSLSSSLMSRWIFQIFSEFIFPFGHFKNILSMSVTETAIHFLWKFLSASWLFL